ncbi:MAG: cobalamin-dependent protein [bacterium]
MPDETPAVPGPAAVRAYGARLEALIAQVHAKFEVDERFECGSFPCELAGMVRDLQVRFGRLLLGAYEFGLTDRLAREFSELVRPVLSRGATPAFPVAVLDAWLVAMRTGLGEEEQRELAAPLERLRAGQPDEHEESPGPEPTGPAREFLDLLLRGERRQAAEYTLHRAGAAGGPEQVLDELILPALTRVGELWAFNRLSVAEEHRATAICRYVIYRVFDAAPRAPRIGRRALVACAPGEEHELGAELTAGMLERSGWEVFLVGRSAPPDEVAATATRFRPDVTLLGSSLLASLPGLRELAGRLRPAGGKLVAGGRAAVAARERLAGSFDAVVRTAAEGRAAAERLAG